MDVARVTSGKRLPPGACLVDHMTPHPYIRVTDMMPGTVSASQVKFVPEDVAESIRQFRIFESDLFISVAGSLGIAGKVPRGLSGANLTENADRITDITCSQDYLLHVLLSPIIQSEIEASQTAGAQPKLALIRLRSFAIPLPPPEEQRAIAAALNDVDALIAALDALIAKKRDIKQATMQQLLTGKTRLPGFSGAWPCLAFGDVLRRIAVKAFQIPSTLYELHGRLPVIDQGQTFIVAHSNAEHRRFACPDGGVIVFGDHTCITKFVDFDFVIGADGTQVLTARAGQHTRFHAYALQHQPIESTGYNRHFSLLKERQFACPPLAEQTAIAEVPTDLDAELAALDARREKTRLIKQGMMQSLLTGQVRLV